MESKFVPYLFIIFTRVNWEGWAIELVSNFIGPRSPFIQVFLFIRNLRVCLPHIDFFSWYLNVLLCYNLVWQLNHYRAIIYKSKSTESFDWDELINNSKITKRNRMAENEGKKLAKYLSYSTKCRVCIFYWSGTPTYVFLPG